MSGGGADPFQDYEPLGFEAGDANLYRYVRNSPTNATDPSGLTATYMEGGQKKAATAELVKDLNLQQYNLPTDAYMRELAVAGITSAAKFEGLVRNIMDEIQKNKNVNFDFASLTQYVNYAKYSAWVVVFAQQLQSKKCGFVGADGKLVFEGSECWESSDKVGYTRPKEREVMRQGLVLKKDVTPAKGIREFFGEKGGKATIDCATFQSLVSRRALLEVMGEKLYNETYKNVAVAGLHVTNDPFSYEIVKGSFLAILIPGMSARWHYEGGVGGPYENENTIFLGGVLFVGHPFDKPLNPTQIRESIERATGIKGTKPDLVTSIDFQKLPK